VSKSIGELQAEIEAAMSKLDVSLLPEDLKALSYLRPAGVLPRVSLRHSEGNRQIRRTADAKHFTPENCVAVVSFEPDDESGVDAAIPQSVAPEISEVVTALSKAESDHRFREFVGLKPFRDQYLPEFPFGWTASAEERDRVLRQAIGEKLILRHQVPNPKAPRYPTTAIRLNKSHPSVDAVLKSTHEARSPFHPIAIRGEPLSSTVIAERR